MFELLDIINNWITYPLHFASLGRPVRSSSGRRTKTQLTTPRGKSSTFDYHDLLESYQWVFFVHKTYANAVSILPASTKISAACLRLRTNVGNSPLVFLGHHGAAAVGSTGFVYVTFSTATFSFPFSSFLSW